MLNRICRCVSGQLPAPVTTTPKRRSTPIEDEHGRSTMSVDLHGHLAGILSLATRAKKPLRSRSRHGRQAPPSESNVPPLMPARPLAEGYRDARI